MAFVSLLSWLDYLYHKSGDRLPLRWICDWYDYRLSYPDVVFEDETRCDVPPKGWFCTRKKGHDGPCAAWPKKYERG